MSCLGHAGCPCPLPHPQPTARGTLVERLRAFRREDEERVRVLLDREELKRGARDLVRLAKDALGPAAKQLGKAALEVLLAQLVRAAVESAKD